MSASSKTASSSSSSKSDGIRAVFSFGTPPESPTVADQQQKQQVDEDEDCDSSAATTDGFDVVSEMSSTRAEDQQSGFGDSSVASSDYDRFSEAEDEDELLLGDMVPPPPSPASSSLRHAVQRNLAELDRLCLSRRRDASEVVNASAESVRSKSTNDEKKEDGNGVAAAYAFLAEQLKQQLSELSLTQIKEVREKMAQELARRGIRDEEEEGEEEQEDEEEDEETDKENEEDEDETDKEEWEEPEETDGDGDSRLFDILLENPQFRNRRVMHLNTTRFDQAHKYLIQHIPTGKFVYGRTNCTTPLALLAKDEVGLLDVRVIIECNRGNMAMDDCWLRTEKHDDRNFVRVEDIPIPPSAVTEATNEGGTSSKAKNGKRFVMHKSVKFLDSQRFAVIPVGKNNSGKGARQFDVTLQLLDYERPVETILRNEDEGAALSDGMFVWADPVSGVLLPRYVASTQQPAAKLMGQFRLVSFVRDPKMYAKMRF